MVKKKLIEIMCCPECKGDVKERNGKIVCLGCGRRYPIKDDIPIMLLVEAELPNDKNEPQKENS